MTDKGIYFDYKGEMVRNEKITSLTDDTLYVNDTATSSSEMIFVHSSSIMIRVPYPIDSMDYVLADYGGESSLLPRYRTQYKPGVSVADVRVDKKFPVQGLFIHTYYQGNQKTFFRLLRNQ